MKRVLAVSALMIVFGLGAVKFGPGAAYYAVNYWRTAPMDTALSCGNDRWTLRGFRAEAPEGRESIVGSEGCALRFTVKEGQKRVKKGVRTELRTNAVPFGQSHRFCFTVQLAEAWSDTSPPVTLVQWHAVPDRLLGEGGRAPPLRLMIEHGQWVIVHIHDDRQNSSSTPAIAQATITFSKQVDWAAVTNWCFDVRWDEDAMGAYHAELDGELVASHQGPFGYRDWIAPFLKFGVYVPKADEMAGGIWTAYFSDIEITSE